MLKTSLYRGIDTEISHNATNHHVFAEYLCYRNTLHKLQDYVAVKSINQYHVNICRSPMAEFVMKDLVEKAGISAQLEIASAATSTEASACAAASFFSSDESAKAQPAAQQEEEQHFTQHRQP